MFLTYLGNLVAIAIVVFIATLVIRSLRREPRVRKPRPGTGSGGGSAKAPHSETRIK